MNWRSFIKLYPSTLDIVQLGVNLIVRTAILTFASSCFLLLGLSFNWLVNFGLEVLEAPEIGKEILSQIALVYILVVGVAATLTSTLVVIYLSIADLRNFPTQVPSDKPGGDGDDKY